MTTECIIHSLYNRTAASVQLTMSTSMTPNIRALSSLRTKGLLNLPGITASSKTFAEELLRKDAESHHCYFNNRGFHNHLPHHVLAAYDLGAPIGLLRNINNEEVQVQRPIFPDGKGEGISINAENWKQYAGNPEAYGALVDFFSGYVKENGAKKALERFLLDDDALQAHMLGRLMSGVVHPFIQIAHGIEFGIDGIIATGLAQTAVTRDSLNLYQPGNINLSFNPDSHPITVLELLNQVYTSPVLKPGPYDPDALKRMEDATAGPERKSEIQELATSLIRSTPSSDLTHKVSEFIWTSTLLMFATGKRGKAPRLDFFIMHLVTSSLFLKSFVSALQHDEKHVRSLLYAYTVAFIVIVLSRGRPRIDATLVMEATELPRPPVKGQQHSTKDEDYNPWAALITSSLHAPDSHVTKSMRTLVYGAREYGQTEPGKVPGAVTKGDDGVETEILPGLAKVDGTLFVRAAGIMIDCMGWVDHGQPATADWDHSALGWDEAWAEKE